MAKRVVRTRIYVDGYNLYYGCLKGTPYKWLDLGRLFGDVFNGVIVDDVPLEITLATPAIKYFTAPIGEPTEGIPIVNSACGVATSISGHGSSYF